MHMPVPKVHRLYEPSLITEVPEEQDDAILPVDLGSAKRQRSIAARESWLREERAPSPRPEVKTQITPETASDVREYDRPAPPEALDPLTMISTGAVHCSGPPQ